MEHGIHVTQNFLSVTGCQTMDELMALTTEQLVDAYLKAAMIDKNCLLGTANFPLLDGVTLPEDRADSRNWVEDSLPRPVTPSPLNLSPANFVA